jgi:hypothetical protein
VQAYRTSGFKDWWTVGATSTNLYVNNLYNVAAAPSGTGWQFTSSDGKITKTITLANGTNVLEASYAMTGISTLYVRHGLSPDLLNLVFTGQANLQGPTSAGGKVSLLNSNSATLATASVNFSDTGSHSNTAYNAAATDDGGAGVIAVKMRNQAQTHQIELVGTGPSFSFALELTATPAFDPNGDDDGDGLPNQWEIDHGLEWQPPNGAVGANGANGDPDGDGMTNMQEFIAGTHPKDGASVLRITRVTRSGNDYQITWTSVPTKNYQVWATSDLSVPFSCVSGCPTIPSAGATTSYTDPSAAGSRKFYRIKVLP